MGVILLGEVGVLCDAEQPLGVTAAGLVGLARLLEPLCGELSDRLEHPVAVLSEPAGAAAEKALVEEGGERVEVSVADGLGGLERAAAAEDSEPGEEPLLGWLQ